MSRRENFWKGERQMHNSNEMGHKCPCQQVKVYMSQKHYEMWGNFPHKLTSLCISIWFWGGSRGVLISIRWAMMNYSLATRNLVSWKYNSCFKTYWFNKFYSKKNFFHYSCLVAMMSGIVHIDKTCSKSDTEYLSEENRYMKD